MKVSLEKKNPRLTRFRRQLGLMFFVAVAAFAIQGKDYFAVLWNGFELDGTDPDDGEVLMWDAARRKVEFGTAVAAPAAHASTHLPGGADALTTASPTATYGGTAGAEGSAASFARSDHIHAFSMPSLNSAGNAVGAFNVLQAGTGLTFSYAASATGGTLTINGGSGTGDVVGPAASTNEALALFDSTTGKLLKNGAVTATVAGAMDGITTLDADGTVSAPEFTDETAAASTGVINLTSQADGDILARASSAWGRLAKGANNTFLGTNNAGTVAYAAFNKSSQFTGDGINSALTLTSATVTGTAQANAAGSATTFALSDHVHLTNLLLQINGGNNLGLFHTLRGSPTIAITDGGSGVGVLATATSSDKRILGYAYTSTSTLFSTTTATPADDTSAPQMTEGASIVSQAYTVVSASSVIWVFAHVSTINNRTAGHAGVLFVGRTGAGDAMQAGTQFTPGNDYPQAGASLLAQESSPGTGSATWDIRAGSPSATAFEANGHTAADKLGASSKTTILIVEVL